MPLAAIALVVCLGLTACGGPAEPEAAPSSDPSPTAAATSSAPASAGPTTAATPSETANRVVVDITIADGTVSPNGQKVDVAVGQEVELNVTSDVDDEIHAHTDSADGYELEVRAGVPATGRFSVASAGSFEVESHGPREDHRDLERTVSSASVVVPLIPLHGLASRHDLPLPFGFVLIGAAAALAITFGVLLLAWRQPRFGSDPGVPVPRIQALVDNRAVRAVARVLVLALFGWVGLAVAIGPDQLTNPVFGFVFVWLWVGLVPLSLIMGPVWRVVNPLRTVHLVLCRLARTDPDQGLLEPPRALGVWPAAFSLFAFAWLELVQPDRTTLSVLRVWVLAWLVIMIIGAVVAGRRWIAAADPFEAYATTVAQLSPWRRADDGRLHVVNPLAGVNAASLPAGTVGVVAVLLGSTAFDSFANLSWWIQTVQASEVSPVLWETGGLLTMIIIVAGHLHRVGRLAGALPRQGRATAPAAGHRTGDGWFAGPDRRRLRDRPLRHPADRGGAAGGGQPVRSPGPWVERPRHR